MLKLTAKINYVIDGEMLDYYLNHGEFRRYLK